MDDEYKDGVGRVLVVGPPSVGKTSLVARLCGEDFPRSPRPTVGCAVSVARVAGRLIELWDLGGHAAFRDSRSLFYQPDDGIDGVMLVCDLAVPRSFHHLPAWVADLASHGLALPLQPADPSLGRGDGAWASLKRFVSGGVSPSPLAHSKGFETGATSEVGSLSPGDRAAAAAADMEGASCGMPPIVLVANKRELRLPCDSAPRDWVPGFTGAVLEMSAEQWDGGESLEYFFREVLRHRQAAQAQRRRAEAFPDSSVTPVGRNRSPWHSPTLGNDGAGTDFRHRRVRENNGRHTRTLSASEEEEEETWASHYGAAEDDAGQAVGGGGGGVGVAAAGIRGAVKAPKAHHRVGSLELKDVSFSLPRPQRAREVIVPKKRE